MKYLKFLNLIPLVLFIIWDRLVGNLVNAIPPIIIAVLAITNIIFSKQMSEYLISSLMLFASTVIGIILLTYFYYYNISANPEAPIVGAFVMIVYGLFVLFLIGVGAAIVAVRKKRKANGI